MTYAVTETKTVESVYIVDAETEQDAVRQFEAMKQPDGSETVTIEVDVMALAD